jgi:hypothetical protein
MPVSVFDQTLRCAFVKRLQNAIVQQEANLRSAQDLKPALDAIQQDRLRDYLRDQYVLPEGRAPKDSSRQIAYSADIFGRMIEDDVGVRNRLTDLLRGVGGLAAQFIGVIAPGSLGRLFWDYWVGLLILVAILAWVYGWLFADTHAKLLGERGIWVVVGLWFFSRVAGSLLAGLKVPRFLIRAIKWLPAIALFVLVVTGARHLPQDAQDFWHCLRQIAGSP